MNNEPKRLSKGWRTFIIVVSIVIPAAVAAIGMIPKIEIESEGVRAWLNSLPSTYATINGLTFFILIGAFVAIRKRRIVLHQRLITFSMILSVAFLALYVTYHVTTPHTKFGGEGGIRILYFTILNLHILLSGIIVPLVLVAYARGVSMMVTRHRKIARIALPLWLFVAASGVVVYLMIRPYYAF